MVHSRVHQNMRGVRHYDRAHKVHHKLVTLNRCFLQKLSVNKNEPFSVNKNEPLTNQ